MGYLHYLVDERQRIEAVLADFGIVNYWLLLNLAAGATYNTHGEAEMKIHLSWRWARPPEERFWEKIDTSGGPDACWPWMGARLQGGYGQFWVGNNRKELAHRFSLALKLQRALLPNMEACHTCHNPPCCNPKHLYEGTHAENVHDMVTSGRQVPKDNSLPHPAMYGEENPTTTLDRTEVLVIYRRA